MFQENTMRVKDAKMAAKLQGGIAQQSAEDATFRQSGVDVESARSAGLIPPVNSTLVGLSPIIRRWPRRKPSQRTLGTASRTLNACPGFAYDAVNREPQREEPAGVLTSGLRLSTSLRVESRSKLQV